MRRRTAAAAELVRLRVVPWDITGQEHEIVGTATD